MTTKKVPVKLLPFHEWLDAEGYTIQQFAQKIGQGFATVASWRAKSAHGQTITLKSASASNIARVRPDCPLLLPSLVKKITPAGIVMTRGA